MTIYNTPAPAANKVHFSLPSLIAVGAAIASFMVGGGLGFFLAIIAIIAGGIGFLMAFAPSVRGGMVSMISIVAGLIGLVAAVCRLLF
jgi:hypothetical protein